MTGQHRLVQRVMDDDTADVPVPVRVAVREVEQGGAQVVEDAPQAGAGTQYDELRWGDAAELLPAARAGSLCCRVLLESRGLGWET